MKRTNIVIGEKLIKEAMKATGIKTRRALVEFALRDLLRRESPIRILELKEKEQKKREGYERKPVRLREFDVWETDQGWVEP